MKVAAGLLCREGRILIGRRREGLPYSGFWEFPGGKMEEGESPQDCVVREFFEELSVRVRAGELVACHTHQYPNGPVEIFLYAVHLLSGSFKPVDHDEISWAAENEIGTFKLLDGNFAVIPQISAYLKRQKL